MRKKYTWSIIFLFLFYWSLYTFFSIYHSNVKSDFLWRLPGFSYFDLIIQKVPTKIFYYNPEYLNKRKADFIVLLSNTDKKINDSLSDLAQSKGIITDNEKVYRKADAIFENKKFKIKYKFHGSSLSPLVNQSRLSYSIKSESKIFEKKNFKLIISYEMDYKNIFLNYLSYQSGLVSEDFGQIVSVKFGDHINDYFMYETFNNSFIEKRYKYEDPLVVRNLTFYNEVDGHSSELDLYSYNLDMEEISYPYFKRWQNLKSLKHNNYSEEEKSSYGNFLAFIYFFGDPHQITGNNDKWIITKKHILPVYRNEGMIQEYNYGLNSNFDNQIFEEYYPSDTYNVYKNQVINNKIRHVRNKKLHEISNKKIEILNIFDSIYKNNIDLHKRHNKNYFKIKNNHANYKKIISRNIDNVKKYLKTGKIISILVDDTLKVSMESYMKMKININNKIYSYNPVNLQIENNRIVPKRSEFQIYFNEKIVKLEIINEVTSDTLKLNEDFKLIKVTKQ